MRVIIQAALHGLIIFLTLFYDAGAGALLPYENQIPQSHQVAVKNLETAEAITASLQSNLDNVENLITGSNGETYFATTSAEPTVPVTAQQENLQQNESRLMLVINDELTLYALNIQPISENYYKCYGQVTINNILGFEDTVYVDKRSHLEYPTISGSGNIIAELIQGSDYNLYTLGNNYTYHAKYDTLTVFNESNLLQGDNPLFGFIIKIGQFIIDENGDYVKTFFKVELPYPIDAVLQALAEEYAEDYLLFFSQVSFGRTYHRDNGISTYGNIGPFSADFGVWAIDELSVWWDSDSSILGGTIIIKIPGDLNPQDKDSTGTVNPITQTELPNIPIELRDINGNSIGTYDLKSLSESDERGFSFLEGLGVEIEFVEGAINRFILYLLTNIPIDASGFKITRISGGLDDIQSRLTIIATVDIASVAELPLIDVPFVELVDFRIKVRPYAYLKGGGDFNLFGFPVANGWISYDGEELYKVVTLKGNYSMYADILSGRVKIVAHELAGVWGSGRMTLKTPSDLPWGLGFLEDITLGSAELSFRNRSWTVKVSFGDYDITVKIRWNKSEFPYFEADFSVNWDPDWKFWKNYKTFKQTYEFDIPENCYLIHVIAGKDEGTIDFSLLSPSGETYNDANTDYVKYEDKYETRMSIKQPEEGRWQFETDETESIQIVIWDVDIPPTAKVESPAKIRERSSTISLNLADYHDAVDVRIYYDLDKRDYNGVLITELYAENNADINYEWDTQNMPNGEYFIYCLIDDDKSPPLKQYAPGSILINNADVETPTNFGVVQEGDSVKITWDPPVSGSIAGTSIHWRNISNGKEQSITIADRDSLFIGSLNIGQKYIFWATNIDNLGYFSEASDSAELTFIPAAANYPPYFTLDPDSIWYFEAGQNGQYVITAEDADGDPISFTHLDTLTGINIINDNLDWIPTITQIGYHTLELTAEDGQNGYDTAYQEVVVYTPNQTAIDIDFSAPTLYEDDNKYIIVSDFHCPNAQIIVPITNISFGMGGTGNVICDRVNEFEYIGKFDLSATGSSLIPVNIGDTIIAVYNNFLDTARCKFRTDNSVSYSRVDIHTDCIRIAFSNRGNLGCEGGYSGDGGYNLDFFDDCDTTFNLAGQDDNSGVYLYDASPFVSYISDNDTILNYAMYDGGWSSADGFSAVSEPIVDSTTFSDYQYGYSGAFITNDSAIMVEVEYFAPTHPDTCNFIIAKQRFYNVSETTIEGAFFGDLMDWDIPSDSSNRNGSDYDATRKLMYCYGAEYGPDSILNNDCVSANNRYGGYSYYGGFKIPYAGAEDSIGEPMAMWTENNATYIYPEGYFVTDQMYPLFEDNYGYSTWESGDPDSLYTDLHMVCVVGQFDIAPNDTLVFCKILASEYSGGETAFGATIDKAKAWIANRPNIWSTPGQADCDCNPGDANNTGGSLNILDITYLISYLYKSGPPPAPYAICSGDPNGNCVVNILDITYLIAHLYQGGLAPVTCEQWLNSCGPPFEK